MSVASLTTHLYRLLPYNGLYLKEFYFQIFQSLPHLRKLNSLKLIIAVQYIIAVRYIYKNKTFEI